MRTKQEIIAEIRAVVKEISRMADEMPDCGGLQGAAVLASHPGLKRKLDALDKEAREIGVTPEDLKP